MAACVFSRRMAIGLGRCLVRWRNGPNIFFLNHLLRSGTRIAVLHTVISDETALQRSSLFWHAPDSGWA